MITRVSATLENADLVEMNRQSTEEAAPTPTHCSLMVWSAKACFKAKLGLECVVQCGFYMVGIKLIHA